MRTYDFSKGKRGGVLPVPPAKECITIRLDCDILDYFRGQVERPGGGNYQTVINAGLRDYVEGKKSAPGLEDTLRRVIREELRKAAWDRVRLRRDRAEAAWFHFRASRVGGWCVSTLEFLQHQIS
jgi:hypothetical protein